MGRKEGSNINSVKVDSILAADRVATFIRQEYPSPHSPGRQGKRKSGEPVPQLSARLRTRTSEVS